VEPLQSVGLLGIDELRGVEVHHLLFLAISTVSTGSRVRA